jgi:hypothetical protein
VISEKVTCSVLFIPKKVDFHPESFTSSAFLLFEDHK